MSNITPTNPMRIEDELANLELYKYHPNGILNVSLTRLQNMYNGTVEISDPGNPFTYLLETSALNTAYAIQEYALLTRKLYPRLANSEDDLYLHMSDFDYLGRFSEPAYTDITINILFSDFMNKAYADFNTGDRILKIPRHFKVSVGGLVFTLTSGVIIRSSVNGIIDIRYENQNFNNIFPANTNYIPFELYSVNASEKYIKFKVKCPEVSLGSTEIPIEKSKLFKDKVTYTQGRQFFFLRAFFMRNGKWEEMLVTHTDEVYDINTPTCVIKVLPEANQVEYYVPPVYINTGKVTNKIKLITYTTKGYIDVNFKDYLIGEFVSEYGNVFPDEELDDTTSALNLITKVIYIEGTLNGGKNGLDFDTLKETVIDNSIGDRQLPITNKQLAYLATQSNFKLIDWVDGVTDRIYKVECNIPDNLDNYPLTKLNLDIIEYKTTLSNLSEGNSVRRVNEFTYILPENTLFKLTNSTVELLSQQNKDYITGLTGTNLTNELNDNVYLSLYYHYIFDTSGNQATLRAYNLNAPTIYNINFKAYNDTTRVGINTLTTNLVRTSSGYGLDVASSMTSYTPVISQTNVKPYIVYKDDNGSLFYIEGNLYAMMDKTPIYRFSIDSSTYIDNSDNIEINSFRDVSNNPISIRIPIHTKLNLIYVCDIITPEYVRSEIDSFIMGSFLGVGRTVVTLEEIDVRLATNLQFLYRQVHSSISVGGYERYEQDVPLRYTANVYNAQNEIIHYINEVVLDDSGDPVISHYKGDVKYDSLGNPIPISVTELDRYLNLLFIDYKVIAANKTIVTNYKNYIKRYITDSVTTGAQSVYDNLLENTELYVVVPKNVSSVTVKTDVGVSSIPSMQSFTVNVYVNNTIYNDTASRDSISDIIIKDIGSYLYSNTRLTKTEMLNVLYSNLKEYIVSVSIDKFTTIDREYIELVDINSRISINKILTNEPDGYNLRDDVTIVFFMVNS